MTKNYKYFKDAKNEVWAFNADGSQDDAIGDKLTPITVEEMKAIVNPPLTPEQVASQAESERLRLRAIADTEIEWRQDAVDAEIATDEEKSALAAWRKYRVLLMRVDTAAPVWPTPPGQ